VAPIFYVKEKYMGVVITGKFTIVSPVTIDELKEDWGVEDISEVLRLESEALSLEFSTILGFDHLDQAENASAELKVNVTQQEEV
jgi:hypothetical protein